MSLGYRRLTALALLHLNHRAACSSDSATVSAFAAQVLRPAVTATVVGSAAFASSSNSDCSASSTSSSRSFYSTSTTAMSAASATTSTIEVAQFPALDDNYGYLVHDAVTGETAAVDTPCAATIRKELDRRGWRLSHVWNTHHHYDHTGGNLELKSDGVTITGPKNEQNKVPGIDVAVGEGDTIKFGSSDVKIMDVGGHTKGHIAYYLPSEDKVFCGDALFALGCGRMFEGTPKQFWKSLRNLRELPDETSVYCAHEYTASNAKFALSVEPGNADLVARVNGVMDKRSRNEATVPSKMGEEKKTNPFLRVDISEEIRKNVGVTGSDTDDDAFAKVRSAKDNFRG